MKNIKIIGLISLSISSFYTLYFFWLICISKFGPMEVWCKHKCLIPKSAKLEQNLSGEISHTNTVK
jgi:hypothetical protein